MPQIFVKDPDATLDYTFDWSSWLETGETIASQTVTTGTGLTEDSVAASDSAITVWVSGGTVGESYEISCEITTDNSPARVDERTITIRIQQQ